MAALGRSDSPDVPPSWQGGGRDWGNLAVAWPTRALPASDPRCERLARRMWAEAGGAGLTCYGDPDSLQGYVGVDLAVWALLADRPAQADSVLGALLEWRTASGTSAELFSRSTRNFGADLPPHPTSAAALTALVRNALIYDDGDTLQLGRTQVVFQSADRIPTPADRDACNQICHAVHGFARHGEVDDAITQKTASVVEHQGRITGYTTGIAFVAHSVAETNTGLMALIGAAPEFGGPGFLLPTRNHEVFTWCLKGGLRLVYQMNLMTVGLYNEPTGAYLPSVLY